MTLRLLVFLCLLGLLLFYVGAKATGLTPRRRWVGWTLTFLAFTLAVSWQFIYRAMPEVHGTLAFQILAWCGGITLGAMATFLLLSLPADLVLLMTALIRRLRYRGTVDIEKRRLLSGGASIALAGVAGGITGLGVKQAIAGPEVKEVIVSIEGLPEALDGLTIAQISDLHVGPTIRQGYVEKVVETVRGLKPDLIAVTGDLVDGTPESLAEHVAPLSGLRAPLGAFYVTGNHEYYWGGEAWIRKVEELGLIPLINEHRVIVARGHPILVAGVTDTSSHQFVPSHRSDPRRAIASPTGKPALRLLLAHRPDSCFAAEPEGYDLQLSGHTHAGQFFPWSLLIPLVHRYYKGLNRHGRMWVYVNVGTGYWGPPHRFAIPSEVTLLRLSAGDASKRSP